MLSFPIPAGLPAWIEDVVVDSAARGKDVGEKLNAPASELARSAGVRTIDLTSRPNRDAANRLCKRLGFQPHNTNVYRLTVK